MWIAYKLSSVHYECRGFRGLPRSDYAKDQNGPGTLISFSK